MTYEEFFPLASTRVGAKPSLWGFGRNPESNMMIFLLNKVSINPMINHW